MVYKKDFIEKNTPALPVRGWMVDDLLKKSENTAWRKDTKVFVVVEGLFVKVKPLTTDFSKLEAAVSQFSVVKGEIAELRVDLGPRSAQQLSMEMRRDDELKIFTWDLDLDENQQDTVEQIDDVLVLLEIAQEHFGITQRQRSKR